MSQRIQYLLPSLLIAGLSATATGQTTRLFRTGDGSPFLLVSIATQSVHWVNLQPAGAGEEPAGLRGLGLAVARASVTGGTSPGPSQESSLSWEKALRRTPASGSRIVQLDDHVGVAVTFAKSGLPKVASLLKLRTRRQTLIGVPQLLAELRRQHRRQLGAMRHLGIMRRSLEAFEASRPLLSVLSGNHSTKTSPELVQAFYRRTYAAARSLNVITGNLQLDETERQLKAVFVGQPSSTAGPDAPPPRPAPASTPARRDAQDTMMLACPIPDDLGANGTVIIDLLAEYLAGDTDAYLPDHLRASGHPRVRTRVYAPFPSAGLSGGGIFLIQISQPGATLKEDGNLAVHAEQALAKIATELPEPDRLARAKAALSATRSAILRRPEGLALLLAQRWVRTGTAPQKGLNEETQISAAEFRAVARQVFRLAGQTLLLPDLGK